MSYHLETFPKSFVSPFRRISLTVLQTYDLVFKVKGLIQFLRAPCNSIIEVLYRQVNIPGKILRFEFLNQDFFR
jgi:hypothetical protein